MTSSPLEVGGRVRRGRSGAGRRTTRRRAASASKAASREREVGGGDRRPVGVLERSGVEDDPDARRGTPGAGAFATARTRRVGIVRGAVGRGGDDGARRQQLLGTQLDDDDEGLDDDPPGHLALADAPVAEGDRHLADAGAGAVGPEGHLDLEHVATGVDAVERDGREGRRAPGLEAAGQVVDRQAQHDPGEEAAAARDDATTDPPVDDAAAGRVARADDEVGLAGHDGAEQGRAGPPDRG